MSKTKIFYVEDEVFLGKIVKESLESRGFEVLMESDGAKAIPLFKKSQPDVCAWPKVESTLARTSLPCAPPDTTRS